jgi:hypothetical protein
VASRARRSRSVTPSVPPENGASEARSGNHPATLVKALIGAHCAIAASAYWAPAHTPTYPMPPRAAHDSCDASRAAATIGDLASGSSAWRGSPLLAPHPVKSKVTAV